MELRQVIGESAGRLHMVEALLPHIGQLRMAAEALLFEVSVGVNHAELEMTGLTRAELTTLAQSVLESLGVAAVAHQKALDRLGIG